MTKPKPMAKQSQPSCGPSWNKSLFSFLLSLTNLSSLFPFLHKFQSNCIIYGKKFSSNLVSLFTSITHDYSYISELETMKSSAYYRCSQEFFHREFTVIFAAKFVSMVILYMRILYIRSVSKDEKHISKILFPLSNIKIFWLGILWRVQNSVCECTLTGLPLYLRERPPEPFAPQVLTIGVKSILKDSGFSFVPQLTISFYFPTFLFHSIDIIISDLYFC